MVEVLVKQLTWNKDHTQQYWHWKYPEISVKPGLLCCPLRKGKTLQHYLLCFFSTHGQGKLQLKLLFSWSLWSCLFQVRTEPRRWGRGWGIKGKDKMILNLTWFEFLFSHKASYSQPNLPHRTVMRIKWREERQCCREKPRRFPLSSLEKTDAIVSECDILLEKEPLLWVVIPILPHLIFCVLIWFYAPWF